MLAVVLRAIVIMPAIPPVIAPTVSVSSPRFTAVKTASFLYFSASPFHSGSAPFLAPFWFLFFCSSFNMLNFSKANAIFFLFFLHIKCKEMKANQEAFNMENNFTYCKACFKKVDCVIKDNVPMVGKINNIQYEYLGREAYCKECGNIVYNPDVLEYNTEALYDKCREVNDLISLQKIREIPQKYNIDNISLSLLLGWSENAFSRFYEGNLPFRQQSDILKKLYDNPNYFSELLRRASRE